jgi:HK97 family phage major capsid protein
MKTMTRDFAAFRARLAGSSAAFYEKREAPDFTKMTQTIEGIGTAFDAYKSANDERIAEIKKNGAVSPETEAKLKKIDAELIELSDLKKRLELVETRAARPGAGATGNGEDPQSAEQIERREAFEAWVRNPADSRSHTRLRVAQEAIVAKAKSDPRERRAAQVITTTASAGGFALPEEIARQIDRLTVDISPIRQIARVVQVGTPDYKELIDIGGTAFEWLGEGATRNQTNTSDLFEVAPTFGMASAKPQTTEEALDDLFFNVEAWIAECAAEAIAQGEGAAFVSGNGTNRPTGFLAGPAPLATTDAVRAFGTLQYIASLNAATLPTTPDQFYDMIYALRARYRANAKWVSSKLVLAQMRKYKDTTGAYLWQPSLVAGQPDMFMGYPIVEAEDMPAIAANTFPVAFGDFQQGYLIADRVGVRMTRDEITSPGFVKFYIRKRVGGRLRNTQAIKLLKCAVS